MALRSGRAVPTLNPPATSRPSWARNALLVGAAAWLAGALVTWPVAFTFADEVGYVGQARLVLDGRVRPDAESPGLWSATPSGPQVKYPLVFPLLLAPLLAVDPRLGFVLGVAAALALTLLAARILDAWGADPCWALVFLIHPTVVLLGRTVMADLALACAAVAAWFALRQGAAALAGLGFAATVLLKPTGIPIAAALLAGEWLRRRSAERAALWATAGAAVGVLLALASNWIQTGGLGYGYSLAHAEKLQFSLSYVPTHGPAYLATLALLPPGLVLGLWPWVRRREWGVVLATLGLVLLISCYFFVDRGRGTLDSLVLSARLVLPAVAFLLIGWAELAGRLTRSAAWGGAPGWLLAAAAVASSLTLGTVHRRWQAPMAEARHAAEDWTRRLGERRLELTDTALKAGLLTRGDVRRVAVDGPQPAGVVLCTPRDPSYRWGSPEVPCRFDGLHAVAEIPPYSVLVPEARDPGR